MDPENEVIRSYESLRFTHIPKCAGTSMRAYLNELAVKAQLTNDQVFIPGFFGLASDKNLSQLNEFELEELRKRNIRIYAGHNQHDEFVLFNIALIKPLSAIILRDPVDRVVSHYYHFNYKLGYNGCKNIRLEQLEKDDRICLFNRQGNLQTRYICGDGFYYKYSADVIIEKAIEILSNEYNVIGFAGHLSNFVDRLKHFKLHWLSWEGDFPAKNVNSEAVKVSDSIIEEISRSNSVDIELYKYAIKEFN